MLSIDKRQTLQEKFNLTPSIKRHDISCQSAARLEEMSERYRYALRMGKLYLNNSKQRFGK